MGPRSSERLLAGAASQLWAMDDLAEFRRGVLSVLHGLIDADIASYNEICRDPPEALVLAEPMDSLGSTGPERRRRFAELILENPLAAHFAATGDPSAQRMSDFISRRSFRALELYDLVYRETGTEAQIAFTVPASGQLIGITMSRTRGGFADDERDLLDRARHLIVPVYRNLLDRARLGVVFSALEGERGRRGPAAVLLVHGSGALEAAHPYAERLLREIVRERVALRGPAGMGATAARRACPALRTRAAHASRCTRARSQPTTSTAKSERWTRSRSTRVRDRRSQRCVRWASRRDRRRCFTSSGRAHQTARSRSR